MSAPTPNEPSGDAQAAAGLAADSAGNGEAVTDNKAVLATGSEQAGPPGAQSSSGARSSSGAQSSSGARAIGRGKLRQTWAEFRSASHRDSSLLGRTVPFLGRRKQLEDLYNGVRDALNSRQVRVAWLHGRVGTGKSRLVAELHRAVAPHKRGVGWFAVDASRTAAGPPTLVGRVLLEVLGGAAVVHDSSPWHRVNTNLIELVGEKHAGECMGIVAPLLGIASPDDVIRETGRVREAPPEVAVQFCGSLLRSRGRSGPFVVVVDGVDANYEELQLFARGMTESLVGISVSIIIESRDGSPDHLDCIDLRLPPLDISSAQALAKHVLNDVQRVPPRLANELVTRAHGNPGRLLDLVRGMIAARDLVLVDGAWKWAGTTEPGGLALIPEPAAIDASEQELPDRVGRLPDELRAVVDAAAIFGPVFWFGGVLSVMRGASADVGDAMSDRDRTRLKSAMMQLQSIDVVVFIENSKMSRELQFAFEHPEDAARIVGRLETDTRRRYGRLAAQWLNCRPRVDSVGDNARIARLYQQGGRLRLAAQTFLEAGNNARNVGQIQRAVQLYAAGTALTDTDDADIAADIRIAHGGALLRLSRHAEAEPVLLQALRMARCLEDDIRCGTAQLRVAQVARVSGRYETALRFLEGALKHLRVAGAHRWIADVMDEIGVVHLVRGKEDAYRMALAHFLKALALRRRSEDRRVVARSLCNIARVNQGRGHIDDAQEAATEAVQISEQIQDRWGTARARMVLGEVLAAAGKARAALTVWASAAEIAEEIGDGVRRIELIILQAEAYISVGQWQDAAALMVDALSTAEEMGDPELLSGVYRVQASISLERDALETADMDSMEAVEIARQSGARGQVARAQLVRGCVLGTRALSESGARSTVIDRKATEAFEKALTAFEEMGDLVRLASGLRSYINYLSQRGGGPRLAAVQARLDEAESRLEAVSGRAG